MTDLGLCELAYGEANADRREAPADLRVRRRTGNGCVTLAYGEAPPSPAEAKVRALVEAGLPQKVDGADRVRNATSPGPRLCLG